MENYIVIASYALANADSGVIDHNLKTLGTTSDIDKMCKLAQTEFEKILEEDYTFLKEHECDYKESPEEHRKNFDIIISDKEDIVKMMDSMMSDGAINPVVIGSLNNFNTEYNYNEHAFVTAIKEWRCKNG